MKKVLLLLFFATYSFAEVPTSMSLSANLAAISSEVGYSFGITSPYFYETKRTSISLTYGQNLISLFSPAANRYEIFSYGIFQLSVINRFLIQEHSTLYFKTGAFFIPTNDLTSTGGLGLNYSLGGELFTDKESFGMYAELGWSFPFFAYANKLQSQGFARGISMAIGLKYYL